MVHSHSSISRRHLLQLGGAGLLGVSSLQAKPSDQAKAKGCIVLFLGGGPPAHEMWDPKPDAPLEIRGPSQTIATATPGLRVGEWMPMTAKLTNKIAVIRSTTTRDNAHSSSGYQVLTGRPHIPLNAENVKPGFPNDSPSLAAMVRYLRGDRGLPGSMIIPEDIHNDGNIVWPGQMAGWLGKAFDPWLLNCDPSQEKFEVPALGLPEDLPLERLSGRTGLLEQLNRRADTFASIHQHELWRKQALTLASSAAARQAFDLSRESPAMRDRYGRTKWGQACLLARRLIEFGVSMVQVNWPREDSATNAGSPLWDTHSKNAERLKSYLMPQFDRGYSALLEDLTDRGMLDSTLVFTAGEFGRSPRINAVAGRDHWGLAFSTTMAGGGVRGGQVIGSTDKIAAMVKDFPVEPQDLNATVLHKLGIDAHAELRDIQGRVIPASAGRILPI
jgi:hypothetical protein